MAYIKYFFQYKQFKKSINEYVNLNCILFYDNFFLFFYLRGKDLLGIIIFK